VLILQSHIVPDHAGGERLSEYAMKLPGFIPSRNGAKKAIKRGDILVDGLPAETGRLTVPGQLIELVDWQKTPPKNFPMQIKIAYEDEYFALVCKPAGIEVSGNKFKTLQNALPINCDASTAPDALKYPRPVHRLDYHTSGLLIVAKTVNAQIAFGNMLEKKEITKRYRAILVGEVPESGQIDTPIGGRYALSEFRRVSVVPSLRYETLSLVDLFPITGRTHQLRIHMASIGHPVLGDARYGREGMILRGKGLFLSAVELIFKHPFDRRDITVSIPQPEKFDVRLRKESERVNNLHHSN
jgi:RluA family pseudouridine synthase